AQGGRAPEGLARGIGKGDLVAVMGPSGSGKTTLLNLMAGLDTPETGEVVVEGTSLGVLADHQLADLRLRKVGFVFQALNLIPALTVEENVAWPLEFSGWGRTDVRQSTAEALRRVGDAGRVRS